MRFRLRTLLIVLAVGPVVLAAGWIATSAFREHLANVNRGIRLQYQQMADEGRRMEKGLPTFTEP
jgi:hypothetical protein